jgi:Tol biopolymer transport system component
MVRGRQKTMPGVATALACGVLLAASQALAGENGTLTQVDVGVDGPPDRAISNFPSISADGRYVVFVSQADNLVEGDTGHVTDVYVRDLATGNTRLVSEVDGAYTVYFNARTAVSGDGRVVAFRSSTYGAVLVKDLGSGETRSASVGLSGAEAGGESPSISADGRFVAFVSEAGNLVPGDTGSNENDVFVRDLEAGVTRRVTVGWTGAEPNGNSRGPSISADGRYIAFTSGASNLVRRDTNRRTDVFLHNLETGRTRRVSVGLNGRGANERSSHPSISANGRRIAFESLASNLVRRDTGNVYVRDLEAGRTRRVDVSWNGAVVNGPSAGPSISADGRFVAFASGAANLVRGDRDGYGDIFIRDLKMGETSLLSRGPGGSQPGRVGSAQPAISADGRFVAFTALDQLHGFGNVYRAGPLK